MICEKTELEGIYIIKPNIFKDHRGEIVEIWNRKDYNISDIPDIEWKSDKISISYKNTWRGLHGDNETWKLISCLYGEIYLVVLNYNEGSKEYGKWQGFVLNDKNRLQVLVPCSYGNGHLILSEMAIFWYKWSEYYNLDKQFSIKWNDPRFDIKLPIKEKYMILSERDRGIEQSH